MSTLERKTVHVSDATGRIAMLEQRTLGTDPAPKELIRFIYSNSIQSANLELDLTGKIISYEEYHPFGTTSYQATNASINAVAKRYRYTGKERDEESGLYYHGARYYIPWLARWSQCDPIGIKDGLNVYAYCSNNPVMLHDPSGMSGEGERIEYSKNPEGKIEGKIDTVVITPNKTELTTDNVNVNQGKELDPSMFSNTGGFGSMALQDENTSSAALIPMNYHKNLIAEQAIYVREQQKITQCIQENQSVLFEDGSGGTVGEIKKAQIAYNQQVGSNVTGGVFGSAAFLAGNYFGGYEKGARWSFGGAALDGISSTYVMAKNSPTIQPLNFQLSRSNNRGYISGFSQIRETYTKALVGEQSAMTEILVAKYLRNQGINVHFNTNTKSSKSADYTIFNNSQIFQGDSKMLELTNSTAGNLSKGVGQVGNKGALFFVPPPNAQHPFSSYQDFLNRFVPKQNVSVIPLKLY